MFVYMSFSFNLLGLSRWLAPFHFSFLSLEMELGSHKSENLIHPLDNFTRHNSTGLVWIKGINCYISLILWSLIAYMFCCLYVFLRCYVFVSQMICLCLLENMYLCLCLFRKTICVSTPVGQVGSKGGRKPLKCHFICRSVSFSPVLARFCFPSLRTTLQPDSRSI